MKKIIHINQHNIKSNINRDDPLPVITVKDYKSNIYAFEVEIQGPCRIIYSPHKPLSCGARVWIETDGEVTPIGKTSTPSELCTLKELT